MEETKQQPLALRVCAELAGSFLLCFAIYAFSTWGSAVYGINIVFFALATGLAYAAVTAIFSRVSGGQLNPAITVASVLVSKTKILDGILYVIAQVIGAIAAGFAVVKLLPTSEQVAAKVWLTPAVNGFENGSVSYSLLTQYGITFSITLAIVVEVVASLIVVATAMSSLGDHGESSDRHVIAMGLAYGLATAISYPVTGAGLNPARSTGIALAAMNEGLTQNPLQQLWVFWGCCCPGCGRKPMKIPSCGQTWYCCRSFCRQELSPAVPSLCGGWEWGGRITGASSGFIRRRCWRPPSGWPGISVRNGSPDSAGKTPGLS